MKYELKQNGSELTVAVEGRLDTTSAPELEEALKPHLKDTDHLIYDFAGLQYISSAGLRVLVSAHMNMRMGGTSRVINSNPVVKEVFEITGLNSFLTIE